MSWAVLILIILYFIFEDHVFSTEHSKKIVRIVFIILLILAILDLLKPWLH